MTEKQLYDAVVEVLCTEVVRRVWEKLENLQKKALVVCTGSTMGFPQWLVGLQQLEQAGFRFDLYLTKGAMEVLDVSTVKMAVPFGKVWMGESEQPPELLALPYATILVPAMTISSAAKIAACTADTAGTRIIFNSMLRGKNVIVAVDGCCPDNPQRGEKGYHIPAPLQAQLRTNMQTLESFGAVLTTAERLASKTLRTIGHKTAAPSEGCGLTPAAENPRQKAVSFGKRLLGRQDVAVLAKGTVLEIPKGCQITQLAAETARTMGIQIMQK